MIAALAIGAIGTAFSAVGAISNANAQAQADRYNAQVAANDAQVAQWNAQMQNQQYARETLQTEQQSGVEGSALEMKNGALEARNINNAASSGVQITGSTKDAILSTAYNGEINALNSNYQGQLLAYQKQVEGSTATYNDVIQKQHYLDQSALFQQSASNAETSGLFAAGGTVLGGVGGEVQRLPVSGLEGF